MTDPFFDALAAALAGQVATALGTAGAAALKKVRTLVRRKSDDDPEMLAALEAAEEPEAEQPQITALAERLDRAAGADAEFAEQLNTEGAELVRVIREGDTITAGDGSVVNVLNGNAEKVINARDVSGGITFH
ncbi:hypothetical protein [Saccharopolyspora sp. CA-218241]|uniref:hypothetical protein n=1 Tax=Saccharopolyspora sp. CA-218241 TaxID=3240027 RepID=UPI003D985640